MLPKGKSVRNMTNREKVDGKVYVTNITSDEIIAKELIEGGLHKIVCDCDYGNGHIYRQQTEIFSQEGYENVLKKGYFIVPVKD